MADRTIKVTLKAEVNDFKRSLGEASSATADVGKKATETAAKSDKAMGQMVQSASRHEAAWTGVGASFLAVGVAAGAMVALSVTKFAEFDEAMSAVQAATHETTANMDLLRDAAINAGAKTMYSASEAASAIEELAKAGVTTADILAGGLAGALDLAAAGAMDVGQAAEIAATAMTMFNISGSQVPHIADLLAAGAGKAQGSVEDMGMALKQAGLVSSQTGLSIEETTGGLAAFASAGLVGSDAGTSFKAMLQRLTPQSKEAQKAMDEMGISAYDSSGNFIGLSKFAGNLQQSLKDLTPEQRNSTMATIFGSDAVRAAATLYNQGSEGVQSWIDKVDDSGYAAETARIKTDNLRGDVERLGGSLDTALIQTGSAANGALRALTQSLEAAVNMFAEWPAAAQGTVLAVGGVTAAVGILGGSFMIAAPKALALKAQIDTLGKSMPKTAGAMRVMSIAAGAAMGVLAIAAVGLTIWAANAANARAKTEALADTLDKTTGAMTDLTRETVSTNLAQETTWLGFIKHADSAYNNATKLGISLELVTDAASGNAAALSEVNDLLDTGTRYSAEHEAALSESGLSSRAFNVATMQLKDSLKGSNATLDEAVRLTQDKAAADAGASDSGVALKNVFDATTDSVEAQSVSLEELIGLQKTAAGVNMSAAEAEASWAQRVMDNSEALDKLNGYIDENGEAVKGLGVAVTEGGASLDLYSEAGQLASDALLGTSNAAWDLLEAAEKAGVSTEDLKDKTQVARDEFIETAMQMGLNEEAAGDLADQYGLIPGNIKTVAELDKAQAEADLTALAAKVRGLPNGVVSISTVGAAGVYDYLTSVQNAINTINGTHIRIGNGAGGQGGLTFADGGYVSGPGTSTSDSIPARLSNGEFVIKADTVQKYGSGFFNNLNAQRFASGGLVGGGSSSSTIPGASTMTNDITINEVTDPVGTSRAIMRRLSGLAA